MVLRWDFKKHAPADDPSEREDGQRSLSVFGEMSVYEWEELTQKQVLCGIYLHTGMNVCKLCGAKKIERGG